MHYSRPTLISNWHKNREAEPKDYDLNTCHGGKKCLRKSTYRHFGTCNNSDWSTTTEAQLSQCHLKNEYGIRNMSKSVLQADNFQLMVLGRDTREPKNSYDAVLPRHGPGHNQIDFNSTYRLDYLPPCDYKEAPKHARDQSNDFSNFKKSQSQFTDTADYRRRGRNTWQDDRGWRGGGRPEAGTPSLPDLTNISVTYPPKTFLRS